MGFRERVIDPERFKRSLSRMLPRCLRIEGAIFDRAQQKIGIGQARVGQRVVRVDTDCLLEILYPFFLARRAFVCSSSNAP